MKAKCNYCGIEFDAQRKSARFCSDSHRTLFGKLTTEEKATKLATQLGVKRGSEITVANGVSASTPNYTIEVADWVKEIEEYCNQQGVLPTDLIETHKLSKAYGKQASQILKSGKVRVQDFTRDKSVGKPYNPMENQFFKKRMDIK